MPSASPILDGELLRAFAAFASHLNFTRAAREVGLSQPAFFERVRRLSDALEVPLYEREGSTLRLTEQGRRVAAFSREELARGEVFLDELRGQQGQSEVTLAAGEGSYLFWLGPAIARFVAGGGRLRPLTLGAAATCEAVLSGEAQLGVAVVDLVPRGLESCEVLPTQLFAVMTARHRLARRRTIKLSELAEETLILPPEGRPHRDFVGRSVARGGARLRPPIEADGWPLMLQFAALGLGVAVVNGVCKLPPRVVARPIPELGLVSYRLLQRRGASLAPEAARLAGLIRALSPPRVNAEPAGASR
jgi:DNA-binding transcriptional LysR family regulator